MNGHGKSFALLDSITFGLFGKPFRKINIPQLINSINEKDCYVEVYFSIGDDEYCVHRGIKPKVFEIYKNEELIDQNAKAKDYQRMLEENILKMNYKSFTQVVILGSSSFVPFMQLTAADRRDVIEDVLDIQVFSQMNSVLKSKASLLKDNLKSLDNNRILNSDRLRVLETHIESLQKANETKISNLEDELNTTNQVIESEERKLSSLLEEQTKYIDQLEEFESLKEKMARYKNAETMITNSLTNTIKKIDFYNDNETCPTCTQDIESTTKDKILKEIESKKEEFEEGIQQVREQIQDIQNKMSDVNEIRKKSANLHEQVVEKRSQIESSRKYCEKIEKEIKSHSNMESSTDITETQEKLEKLKEEQAELIREKEEIKEEGVLLGCLANLLKDTGIKSKIIRHYLPIMNKLINKFLSDMGFFAQFHLDENFNETIKSRFRDTFSYMSFSEGEKMRIDLALLLAWREIARIKNSANTNLLILDEVFDSSLDAVGTEEFMKLMSVLSASTNVFVISHKSDQLVDKFENQITFVKSGNFSKVS